MKTLKNPPSSALSCLSNPALTGSPLHLLGVFFMEEWKSIVDYEGYYDVSTMGNVRRSSRVQVYSDGRIFHFNKKIISKYICNNGYYTVGLTRDSKTIQYSIHRIMAIAFIPNPDNKPEVNHKDGIKLNNTLDNLEWNTTKENAIHAVLNGLTPIGEKRWNAKLSNEQVINIRKLFFTNKIRQSAISKLYGVPRRCISKIINNITYKYIKNNN
jgi:predicted XRE-type DNA-binding protein